METVTVTISVKMFEAMLNKIAERPYLEVAQLIAAAQKDVQTNAIKEVN